MSFYETTVKLPSRGVFYENDLDTLTLRNLSTDDEQKIYGSTSNDTLDKVLSDCVVDPKGFDINTLLPADKFYTMVQLRIHTYGSMYKQPMYCIHCDKEGEVEYSLDDLEVVELPQVKLPIRVKLPVSKDIVELGVLTSQDIKSISRRAEKTAKNMGGNKKELEFMLKLSKQIKSINDKDTDVTTIMTYVKNIHAKDRAYIESVYKKLFFGYKSTLEVKCPFCGKDLTIPFEMNGEFFNPSFEVEFL